jgi:hypothetical protein
MKRERSKSFYIPNEKIEEHKSELTPINRAITTIEEGREEKEEVDPEISTLAHMVDQELKGDNDHKSKKRKVASSAKEELEIDQDEFYYFDDMNLQGNQVNGTGSEGMSIFPGSEETGVGASMEMAGLSCSSVASSVIDTK